MNGVDELITWSGNTLNFQRLPLKGGSFGSLSQVYNSSKGILGVDVGASATTVAASFGGELSLGVYPQLGLGNPLPTY